MSECHSIEMMTAGAIGGALVPFFRWLHFAKTREAGEPIVLSLALFTTCLAWLFFILVGAAVAWLVEPEDRFRAAFEGAALPFLFYSAAKHYF